MVDKVQNFDTRDQGSYPASHMLVLDNHSLVKVRIGKDGGFV